MLKGRGCPQHNSKRNDHKVFKLGVGNDLEISYSDVVWVLKGQRSTLGLGLGYSNAE